MPSVTVNSFEECVVYIVAAVLDLMWLFKGSVLCIEHYSLGGGGGWQVPKA